MRIQSRVLIIIAASVLISVAIAFLIASILGDIRRDLSRSERFTDILNEASALNTLVYQFKERPTERTIKQLSAVNVSLGAMLQGLAPLGAREEFLARAGHCQLPGTRSAARPVLPGQIRPRNPGRERAQACPGQPAAHQEPLHHRRHFPAHGLEPGAHPRCPGRSHRPGAYARWRGHLHQRPCLLPFQPLHRAGNPHDKRGGQAHSPGRSRTPRGGEGKRTNWPSWPRASTR